LPKLQIKDPGCFTPSTPLPYPLIGRKQRKKEKKRGEESNVVIVVG
jgi:hypothetical protein